MYDSDPLRCQGLCYFDNTMSNARPELIQTLLLPFVERILPLFRDIFTTVPSEFHLVAFLPSRVSIPRTLSLLYRVAQATTLC
jgi:hypothetical protein